MSRLSRSPEGNQSFFRSLNQGLRTTFSAGLFGIALGIASIHESIVPPDSIELFTNAPKGSVEASETVHPADSFDYSFSLSIDCLLSFGRAKQIDAFGLSKETYLPLEMGMKQGGLSDIFMIGQRAPGAKEGGRITDGWAVVYNGDDKRYYIHSINTENRIPEGNDQNNPNTGPVPHLVIKPLDVFGQDELSQMIKFEFGGMVLSIDKQPDNPFGPLHFSLTCKAPAS